VGLNFEDMRSGLLFYVLAVNFSMAFSQFDSVKIGLSSYVFADTTRPLNIDSLLQCPGDFRLNPTYYVNRYTETDLMYKITDNKGNGFARLYGTRNLRPILHGVAYRGGANNYFHLADKRDNQNPLPLDGITALCREGFSSSVYLYRTNFENYPTADTCDCVDSAYNTLSYHQLDYYDSSHVYEMVRMTYESAVKDEVGPVYFHCWNGWHASGYVAAVLLKQFCKYSDWDAVNYWDIGTDGSNNSPRYQTQREQIKKFKTYPQFEISDSLRACLCPPMPEHIDSTQLHIEIEHLVIVPEAISPGFQIVLYNVHFGSGKTTFGNISGNADIVNLKKALDADPLLRVEIGGYTDNSGSFSKNVDISSQRARFVYDHLIASGYDTSRVSYRGYGPAKPIYSNRYASTREGNRRIEIKILAKTEHGSGRLVDESFYDQNVRSEEDLTKSYLSYFFNHPGEQQGSVFIVDSLNFESGDTLLPEIGYSHEVLKSVIAYVLKKPGMQVNIKGFTDSSGLEDNNIEISRKRARAVYEFLAQNGLPADRMRYFGYGSSNPIAPNRYLWGRDINRRIEIEFVAK